MAVCSIVSSILVPAPPGLPSIVTYFAPERSMTGLLAVSSLMLSAVAPEDGRIVSVLILLIPGSMPIVIGKLSALLL